MEDALAFFAQAPTTAIADASIALGLDLVMEGVGPLVPMTQTRVAAPATTLRFAPVQGGVKGGRVSLYGLLEEMPPGHFVIMAANATPMAVLGANGARVIHRRGAAGVVADGRARDVLEIRDLGLPVWCRGVRPLPYSQRLELVDRDVPVPCAGVTVAPGDIVVADADGVAVVPRGLAERVRERTRVVMETEAEFNRGFEKGASGTELVKLIKRKWE